MKTRVQPSRWSRYLGVLAVTAAALSISTAFGQEGEALVRVDPPPEPVRSGESFSVNLVVDEVAHLAAFQFTLLFDPEMMEYRSAEKGPFLGSSGRDVLCQEPSATPGSVSLSCVTTNPPVSEGGPSGPSGSGVLATVTLEPRKAASASLDLSDVLFVLDDLDPNGEAVTIPSSAEGAVVEVLGGSGGGFAWGLWGPIIAAGAVAALAGVGFGAARRLRRRGPQPAKP